MKAVAHRVEGFVHRVEVDGHELLVDEPTQDGGTDKGPSPTRLLTASLASCTAITVVMYADRKGWELGDLEVSAEFETPKRGETARFDVTLRLPAALSDEQVERLGRWTAPPRGYPERMNVDQNGIDVGSIRLRR